MAHKYKIISPEKKVYIGSSVDIKIRLRKYKGGHCKGQKRLYASFLKYGIDNHKFEIITECAEAEMYKLEAVYGHMYDVLGPNGLNCKLPKHDESYQAISQETKDKIRKSNTGKIASEEAKHKNSLAHLGKKMPENTREKLKEANKGRKPTLGHKFSEETREKMRLSHKGLRPYRRGLKLNMKNGTANNK